MHSKNSKKKINPALLMLLSVLMVISGSSFTAYRAYNNQIRLPILNRLNNTQHMLADEATDKVVEEQTEATEEPEEKEISLEKITSSSSFMPIAETVYTYSGIDTYNCKAKPNDDSYTVCYITTGTHINVIGEDSGYYVIHIGDGIYAYGEKSKFVEGECYATFEDGVDLRGCLPQAVFALDFSTADNITGRSQYPAIPIMENTAATALLSAAYHFLKDGYAIKVYDAYRPISAQFALYNAVANPGIVPNPTYYGSWHNYGCAIDMTLVDIHTGEEMDIPTEVHVFDDSENRSHISEWTEEQRNNVVYMTGVMSEYGFSKIDTEWYHFEYLKDDGGKLDKNLNYYNLIYEPAS